MLIVNYLIAYSVFPPIVALNQVPMGLRNVSAKKITITTKAVICQAQLANMIPKLYALLGQMSTEANQEDDGSWILQKVDLGGLQQ